MGREQDGSSASPKSANRQIGEPAPRTAGSPRELRQSPDPDWNKLIPELKDWNGGAGTDPECWVACEGNFQLAVAYTTVFWPRFVEHDGMVLRDGFSADLLESWIKHINGDRTKVEAMMNHLHVADIHPRRDATRERVAHLGRI